MAAGSDKQTSNKPENLQSNKARDQESMKPTSQQSNKSTQQLATRAGQKQQTDQGIFKNQPPINQHGYFETWWRQALTNRRPTKHETNEPTREQMNTTTCNKSREEASKPSKKTVNNQPSINQNWYSCVFLGQFHVIEYV